MVENNQNLEYLLLNLHILGSVTCFDSVKKLTLNILFIDDDQIIFQAIMSNFHNKYKLRQ